MSDEKQMYYATTGETGVMTCKFISDKMAFIMQAPTVEQRS